MFEKAVLSVFFSELLVGDLEPTFSVLCGWETELSGSQCERLKNPLAIQAGREPWGETVLLGIAPLKPIFKSSTKTIGEERFKFKFKAACAQTVFIRAVFSLHPNSESVDSLATRHSRVCSSFGLVVLFHDFRVLSFLVIRRIVFIISGTCLPN